MGTSNREPQEYNGNTIEYKDPGRYILIIFLLYAWGSLFGVPSRVPLLKPNTPNPEALVEGIYRSASSARPSGPSTQTMGLHVPRITGLPLRNSNQVTILWVYSE